MASLLGSMIIQHMDRFGHAAEPHQPFGMDSIHRKKSHDDSLDTHRLTHQQKVELGLESENEGDVRKRNFLTDSGILWPQGIIPYEIDSSLSKDSSYVKTIEDAARMFSNLTCLKWVKRDDPLAQNLGHSSYISFFSESGCWSYVGKVFKNKQQISLQAPWCVTLPIVIHEMCHAIGQMHEQSRSDRDNYITILWQNVRGGRRNNNMAKSVTLDNNPYDYESVLQYGLYSFSSNGQPSMELTDRRLDFLADSATGLMFYDVQDVIDAYQCTKQCTTKPACQNGGFVNHRCECFCPSGLRGNLCQSTTSSQPACGRDQILVAPGMPSSIQTPNYPNLYPLNIQCVWLVKAPAGMFIKMTIDDLHLSDNGNTCYHWLEIQYNLLGQTGPRRCGVLKGISYRTSKDGHSNIMLLKFDSAFAADRPAAKGFKITLEAVGPGCSTNPCLFGTCVERDGSTYTCNCYTGWQGNHCDIPDATTTLTCTLESGSACFMDNVKGDDFDWTIHTGPTPSSNTGPTAAKEGDNYLYTEMSSPRKDGDIARYETSIKFLGPLDYCLTFWYSMYGDFIGTLNVYTYTVSIANKQILWTRSKEQGRDWLWTSVTVSVIPDVKIGFEMIGGSSWKADIALDDISMSPGRCSILPTTPTAAPTTSSTTRITSRPTTPFVTTTGPHPCNSRPCLNGGTCMCRAGSNNYWCKCAPMWTGPQCETFVSTPSPDPCNSRPCFNGGTCMSQPGSNSFWCQCAPMWTGPQCETYATTPSQDPCFSQPCMNNGTCNSYPGAITFWCTCSYQWTGPLCEHPMLPDGCISHQCRNNATCYSDVTLPDGYYCVCDIGWSGLYCDIPITNDPCIPNPCMHNGSCYPDQNSLTGASCLCPPEWSGLYCEMPTTNTTHLCSPNPCMNNGTCYTDPVSAVGFSCACLPGWSGFYCEIQITPGSCFSNACLNNGTCYTDPNSPNGYYCLCPPSWTGSYCELPTTTPGSCFSNACLNNGTCYTDPNFPNGYYCLCPPSWTGSYCELPTTTPGSCFSNACLNNGTCYTDPNSPNGYYCLCPPSWTGSYCELPTMTPGSCFSNACLNNGTCYTDPNSPNGYYCLCPPSWTGLYCELPTTTPGSCFSNACLNNGTCYTDPNSPNGYYCACPPSWTGLYCELPTTTPGSCFSNACLNNGTCYADQNSPNGYYCLCPPSWTGSYCELPTTTPGSCFSNTCMNNGTCYTDPNSPNGYYCLCPPSWTGLYCEIPMTPTGPCYNNPCMNNASCMPNSASPVGYNCYCLPGWTGVHCETSTGGSMLTCSVEEGEPCFLSTMNDKSFKWKKQKGRTPSHWTGPSEAHGGQSYYFIETSSPRKRGDEAWLESTDLYPYTEMCLTFFYHAYGSGVGSLIVYHDYGQGPKEIWRIDGNQGNAWHEIFLPLPSESWSKVFFTGVRGNSYKGDIAIDDITVKQGTCGPPPTIDPGTMHCYFEQQTNCFLRNAGNDDFDWTRKKGRTPSSKTGPDKAAEGLYYSYIEASRRKQGQYAILESEYLPYDYMCLHFQYSMYGSTMGELSIVQESSDFTVPVFFMKGSKGTGWHQAHVELTPLKNSKLKIIGMVGSGYRSDMAIDDVFTDMGQCLCASNPCRNGGSCITSPGSTLGYYCSCPPEYTSTDCSVLVDPNMYCGFETDICLFHQRTDDDFDWTRKSGRTRSSGTGPDRASNGEYYMYIESSARKKGDKAVMETSSKISGSNCVVFSYHMHGKAVGELNVSISDDISMPISLWTRRGSMGNFWHKGAVPVYSPTPYKVLVSANVGSPHKGDIAVDDMEIVQGTCGCASSPCLNGGTCFEDAAGGISCQCSSGFTGIMCDTLVAGAYRCDFSDPNNCFLKNTGGDDFDWSFGTSTPSHNTGPPQPYDGKFAYIEASRPRRRGHEAVLTSIGLNITPGDYCLEFHYNMYGKRMGSLRVILASSDTELWEDEGDQGIDWHLAKVDVPITTNEEIEIIAERGQSYTSDAAIDEVTLSPGRCIHNFIK